MVVGAGDMGATLFVRCPHIALAQTTGNFVTGFKTKGRVTIYAV